jgi:hypothetical protein
MIWLAIQKSIGNFIFNQDLHRPYSGSLAKRTEGFTEEWNYGDDDNNNRGDNNNSDKKLKGDNIDEHIWNPKEVNDSYMLGPPGSRRNVPLRLVQYRPAWLEQLVLRIARQPHQVFNSPYSATEFTGQLPMLQDFQSPAATTTVAMVGRYQPLAIPSSYSNNNSCHRENAILHYLKVHHHIDLDKHLNETQRDQSILYRTLIRETLNPCAQALRYTDEYTWMQLYRPQSIMASLTHGNTVDSKRHRRWGRPLATFQAWNERIQNSFPNQRDIDTAIRCARQTYEVLERKLEEQQQQRQRRQQSKKLYLLGTESPTLVDCFLWDHIMQALTDVHLVVALVDFPRLIQFTQDIWDTYQFGMAIDDGNPNRSWTVWNFEQNALNAFNDVPLLPKRKRHWEIDEADQQSFHTKYQDAIELMKRISVQPLQETLQAAKAARERTMRLESQRRRQQRNQKSGSTWYRWRMGDTLFAQQHSQTTSGGGTASKTTPNEEKLIRDYKRNDEIWIASVAVTTAVAIIVGMGMSNDQQQRR